MNLGDPDLELIDPTPNVHTLFIHFDELFFWTKLASRAVVRWSKRMYSCAGVCSYEGRGGLCDIALSEPLLKLRPRKDLIETLLHEMIHAFLFVTNRDQDRDGHGSNFKSHMNRINMAAGINITIYHDFHDEVKLYQTHWWRCNGPCQTRKPYFGIVRRSANRAPGPKDQWWESHRRMCGGTFVKIKEPEKKVPQKQKSGPKVTKPNADITKFIISNVKTINQPTVNNNNKSILKDSNNVTVKTKSNSSSTVLVTKKEVGFNPTNEKPHTQPIQVFSGTGQVINPVRNRTKSADVIDTVRNIWANKQIPNKNERPKSNIGASQQGITNKINFAITNNSNKNKTLVKATETTKVGNSNPNKHKADSSNIISPPAKVKRIDDYFKATSVLKDLYGDDIKLTQANNSTKLVAVSIKTELVDCPVCSAKVGKEEINRHLDECLNKEVIEQLSQTNTVETVPEVKPHIENKIQLPHIPKHEAPKTDNNKIVDLTNFNAFVNTFKDKARRKTESEINFKPVLKDLVTDKKVPEGIGKIKSDPDSNTLLKRSDSLVTKHRGDELRKIKVEDDGIKKVKTENVFIKIKSEPGTSRASETAQICPCCDTSITKPVEEHLDECLAFFDNNSLIPEEGASTSAGNMTTVVIDDEEDDIFDETITLNATGTKTPCPCCMQMVEIGEMNEHLDVCLQ